MITEAEIADAIKTHATMDAIVKQATEKKDAARKKILAFHNQAPDEFRPDPKSATGKTKLISRGQYTTSITFPEAQAVPAHFDQDKTEALVTALEDTWERDFIWETLCRVTVAFDEEKFLAVRRAPGFEHVERLAESAARLIKSRGYMLPEAPGKPQSPRVQSTTGAK